MPIFTHFPLVYTNFDPVFEPLFRPYFCYNLVVILDLFLHILERFRMHEKVAQNRIKIRRALVILVFSPGFPLNFC